MVGILLSQSPEWSEIRREHSRSRCSTPDTRDGGRQRWPARPIRAKRLGRPLTDPKALLMLDGELRSTTSGSPLSTALVVSARLVVVAKCVASNESVTLFDP